MSGWSVAGRMRTIVAITFVFGAVLVGRVVTADASSPDSGANGSSVAPPDAGGSGTLGSRSDGRGPDGGVEHPAETTADDLARGATQGTDPTGALREDGPPAISPELAVTTGARSSQTASVEADSGAGSLTPQADGQPNAGSAIMTWEESAPMPSTRSPSDPPAVSLILSRGIATLRWSAANGEVSGYRVRRQGSIVAELDADARSFSEVLPPGEAITYRLTAFGPGGESPGAVTNTVSSSGEGVDSVQENTAVIGSGIVGSVQQTSVNSTSGGETSQSNRVVVGSRVVAQ